MNNRGQSIAIIGSGIAGLATALNLDKECFEISMFDKSQGFGGRVSTRRVEEFQFDHGAQYIENTDGAFKIILDQWKEADVIKPWTGIMGELVGPRIVPTFNDETVYVGTPKMSSIGRYLVSKLKNVEFYTNTKVKDILKKFNNWYLFDENDNAYGPYDYLVVTIPPPQALELVKEFPHLVDILSSVKVSPRWALMVGLKHRLTVDYDGVFVNHPILRWMARNTSKPERPGKECWVLHATKKWSTENVDQSNDWVSEQLFDAFKEITGFDDLDAELLVAHRWRYATIEQPLDQNFIIDQDRRIAFAGDFCLGHKIENAYMSGQILGRRLNILQQ